MVHDDNNVTLQWTSEVQNNSEYKNDKSEKSYIHVGLQ